MKKAIFIITVFILFFSALYGVTKIRKSGYCTINKCGPFDRGKISTVEIKNSLVSLKFELRADDSFGYLHLSTTPSMKNLSVTELHVAYNIAFFDSMGKLIACTSSSSDLASNADNFFAGSNMPEIPEEDLSKISKYQIVVYVSKK